MERKDMIISEINRLYAVMDEIRSEYDKLSNKMARDFMDGDVLSDSEHAQFILLHHLLKTYNGGNEDAGMV